MWCLRKPTHITAHPIESFYLPSTNFAHAAAHYSTVPLFEQQQHDVDNGVLHALAHVFVRHELHEDFGISLLHRHYDIAENTVMVHTKSLEEDRYVDRCRAEMLGLLPIHPILFYLNNQREYLPCEYLACAPKKKTPSEEYLQELASLLQENNLENVLGLSIRTDRDEHWLEQMLPDDTGTMATITSLDDAAGRIPTGWAFRRTADSVSVKVTTDCKKASSSGHDRPPPQPPKK